MPFRFQVVVVVFWFFFFIHKHPYTLQLYSGNSPPPQCIMSYLLAYKTRYKSDHREETTIEMEVIKYLFILKYKLAVYFILLISTSRDCYFFSSHFLSSQ